MIFSDKVSTSAVRKTSDGYLVADAAVARTGIQYYLGSEVGKPDMSVVRVYRPSDSVFAKDAMKSYAHRPMTNDHPSDPVSSDNWKDLAIGQTGGDVMRDGDYVRVPLVLMDQAAINDWESGKVELSMGYSADIVFGAGVTDSGEAYDAIQTNLKMNHLALVNRARGGEKLRIGDTRNPGVISPAQSQPEGGHMADLRKVVVDGLTIEVTDQGAQVIEKLNKQIADHSETLSAFKDSLTTALAAKDADIAKRDAEIDSLKAKVMDAAALDAAVTARADLIASAKLVADQDYAGKNAAEIRSMAVAAKFGDAAVSGKSAEYIEARFDIALSDAEADPVQKMFSDNKIVPQTNVRDNGQSAYEARLLNAHKENK